MAGYQFARLKIIVVADNPHMRKVVFAILHGFGVHHIVEAACAEEAWALLGDFRPDIIFLDWMMGGMTGVELTRMIRTNVASPDPHVPIIMLTGHTSIEYVREARDAGVTEFLAKPVSAQAILSRLAAVIEHPRAYVRTEGYFGPDRRRRVNEEYRGPERRDEPAAQSTKVA